MKMMGRKIITQAWMRCGLSAQGSGSKMRWRGPGMRGAGQDPGTCPKQTDHMQQAWNRLE